jgi:hypothetical protein
MARMLREFRDDYRDLWRFLVREQAWTSLVVVTVAAPLLAIAFVIVYVCEIVDG